MVGGLASLGLGALAVHALPGTVAWRSARCAILPRLSGVGRAGHVALTFDDGPDPQSTPMILEALDRFGWKATFFCLGVQAERRPDLVAELVARGHEVGVHGFQHRSHLRRPPPPVIKDVAESTALIRDLSGAKPVWLRPPYGALSTSSLAAAHKVGLQLVLWTTWGLDWKPGSTGESVARHVARTWKNGATVLLHDSDLTSSTGSWRATLDALPILHRAWTSAGLEIGTLGEHFS